MTARFRNGDSWTAGFVTLDRESLVLDTAEAGFLADRTSGRLAVIVDGVLVGQVNPRAAEGPRNLGRGVMIVPQPSMPCTFSDIWVEPWTEQIPKKNGW